MSSWCKTIDILADTFRLAHNILLKLKKYEGLVCNEDQTVTEINEIMDLTSNMKVNTHSKTLDRDQQNKYTKNYTFLGHCWKCGKFGHSAKEC